MVFTPSWSIHFSNLGVSGTSFRKTSVLISGWVRCFDHQSQETCNALVLTLHCPHLSVKTFCPPGHRDPTTGWVRRAFQCLSVSCRGMGQQWPATGPGALAAADLEGAACEPDLEPPSRQPTSWRTILPKKFSHCYGSSRAHNRFPDLGIWQRNWDPSGTLTLEASGIWLQNFHRTGETDSWRAQTKLCAHQDPGERSSDPALHVR